MSKNIIPKENFPKVEEVRYLENQDQKPQKEKKSAVPSVVKEVFKNLIWKNKEGQEFYRVFGSWKCDNQKKKCGKGWNSAYTWILLQKYKDSIPVKELDKNKDYYQQECKACTSKINRLIKYEHLKLSENESEIKPHRTDLCAKCKTEEKCWDFIKSQQRTRYQFGSKFLSGFGKRFFRF